MPRKPTVGYVVEEDGFGLCDLCDYGNEYGQVLCHSSKTAHLFPNRLEAQRAINRTFDLSEKEGIPWHVCRIKRMTA